MNCGSSCRTRNTWAVTTTALHHHYAGGRCQRLVLPVMVGGLPPIARKRLSVFNRKATTSTRNDATQIRTGVACLWLSDDCADLRWEELRCDRSLTLSSFFCTPSSSLRSQRPPMQSRRISAACRVKKLYLDRTPKPRQPPVISDPRPR